MKHVKLFEAFVNEAQSKVDKTLEPLFTEINMEVTGFDGGGLKLLKVDKPRTMWTHLDGSKYKDPNRIVVDMLSWRHNTRKERFKMDSIKKPDDLVELAWEKLSKMPRAKKIEISSEIGEDKWNEAYQIGDYIYTKIYGFDGLQINVQSKAILKNTFVWKIK
jgi:hypothetical protein